MEKAKKFDSEFKYLYGSTFKDKFIDLKVPNSTDSHFVKCNGYFTAIPWKATGGGQLAVMRVDDYARFTVNDPFIKAHLGPIIDFGFSPFYDNVLATASEDGQIGIWTIPLEGLDQDMKTPNVMLQGHQKKITNIDFNPAHENLLASNGFDKYVKVWDVFTSQATCEIGDLIAYPTDMRWNDEGSLLAITDNAKKLHVVDHRSGDAPLSIDNVHDGPKKNKCTWLGSSNRILTTGMSKQMLREIAVWDCRDLSEPLARKKIDKNIEVSDPFYVEEHKLVVCAVKGDARVNFWQIVNDDEMIYAAASYKGDGSTRGFSLWPQKFAHTAGSEICRGVRLTDKQCEYVTFRLPNTLKMDNLPSHDIPIRVYGGGFESTEEITVTTSTPVVQAVSSSAPVSSAPLFDGVSKEDVEELKQQYQSTIDDLQADLDNSNNKVSDLEKDIETHVKENERLTGKITELEHALTQAQNEAREAQAQAADFKLQAENAIASAAQATITQTAQIVSVTFDEPAQVDLPTFNAEPAQQEENEDEKVSDEPEHQDLPQENANEDDYQKDDSDNDDDQNKSGDADPNPAEATNTQDLLAELEDEDNNDQQFG